MVGTKLLGQMGNFGKAGGGISSSTNISGIGGLANFGKDGAATERSNYQIKDSGVDKSFVSTGGGFMSHGAVGGIGGALDSSLLNNNLSTPSSEKS